ncbi:CPBP family intramembrane glutamic endopeptidase [Lysinibacillus cavernae]|uniref:CPBP family intramembrane glutamic endopeptidase n=1 Tax=Lysinibacillus cavernae TaxID=2666135 RepID=UPI001E2E87B7|nr:CPBP family intramembrane glutamic endopeptidase [Lysinibacillus cavernae]
MKNYFLLTTTLCLYSLTLVTHYFLTFLENGRAFLGVTMVIPLVSVVLVQKIFAKMSILPTFSISKPTWPWLLASIFIPFSLGIILHFYFYVTHHDSFLIKTPFQLIFLSVIGLTISTGSAFLEEIVWRGNYHVSLRQRFSFGSTAFIIGVLWSFWHLPIALIYKLYILPGVGIPSYLVLLFVLSLVLSIVREYGQSIIPVAIFHGMMNVFYLSEGQHMTVSIEKQELIKCLMLTVVFFLLCHRFVTIPKNKNI